MGIMNYYYTYDLEVYPNIFTFCGKFKGVDQHQLFEISDRRNDINELYNFLIYLRDNNVEMVGFNNIGYDYFLIHELLVNPQTFTYQKAFEISQKIIEGMRGGRGMKRIAYFNRIIPQIDMMKVCHFDNKAKMTSLKALQFAMRSESVEDLPFDIRPLNDQEKDLLCQYNVHDVVETEKFFLKNEHAIDMRREYITDGILKGDVLNYSDVKIGTEYLITRLGKNKCYAGGKPRQTFRTVIDYRNIILPKIKFRTEKYQAVLNWFMQQSINVTGGTRPKLETELCGLKFDFGVGGVHASADGKIFHTDGDYQIIDIDVAGMYPAVAIANKFAPEHLGESFNLVYAQIKADRARYAKGTPRNAALKLAGNGAYGNSNNPYSPLYDPKFTFSITVNGQLQILQLVEMIDLLPDCELIQANTDGITIRLKKGTEDFFYFWYKEWERMTGLVLEEVLYNRMWIRDVNNYIAETMEGKLKRKGAYWYPTNEKEYDGWWNKNFSNHASRIAAEKYMTHGYPIVNTLKMLTDPFDFMLRYKATGASQLFIGEEKQLRTVRYYVSVAGQPMKKVSPPKGKLGEFKRRSKVDDSVFKSVMNEIGEGVWDERIHTKNKSKYSIRETSIEAGWNIKQCNHVKNFNWRDVDWNYYIEEAKKLIIGDKNV